VLSGTPDNSDIGSYYVNVTVEDGRGGSDYSNFTLTVDDVNEPPTAEDDYATILEDNSIIIDVLANDTDSEDGMPTLNTITIQPTHGTATIIGDQIEYTPNPEYNGIDAFEYQVIDNGGLTDTATVTITVESVNDAPTADFIYSPDNPTVSDTISFTDMSSDIDGIIVNWTWEFGDGDISYLKNPQHKYNLDGQYIVNLTVRDNNNSMNHIFKTIVVRNIVPQNISVKIVRPINRIYIFDTPSKKAIMTPFIIGKITIRTEVRNAIGAVTIEYYIDDDYKANNTQEPYEWLWNERAFGKHTIKVIARDSAGKTDSDSIEVRIINVFGTFRSRLGNLLDN